MPISNDPTVLIERARAGDRRSLARLLSIVEDDRPDAATVLSRLYRSGGRAWTVGITGAPGAGKSSLVDAIVGDIRSREIEVAVLAVDPSSPFTGGAVLGDRIRMQDHIDDAGVYIRSMATRGTLGGISVATPRGIVVLDGIGFSEVIVETVGVGQSEVEVAAETDTTIVVVNPGWGDSIQAAKAGLLEVGDIFVINKADRGGVEQTSADLMQMLTLGGDRDWWPPIIPTVATTGDGLQELVTAVADHRSHIASDDRRTRMLRSRSTNQIRTAVDATLHRLVSERVDDDEWAGLVEQVVARATDPWAAAHRLTSFLTNG